MLNVIIFTSKLFCITVWRRFVVVVVDCEQSQYINLTLCCRPWVFNCRLNYLVSLWMRKWIRPNLLDCCNNTNFVGYWTNHWLNCYTNQEKKKKTDCYCYLCSQNKDDNYSCQPATWFDGYAALQLIVFTGELPDEVLLISWFVVAPAQLCGRGPQRYFSSRNFPF